MGGALAVPLLLRILPGGIEPNARQHAVAGRLGDMRVYALLLGQDPDAHSCGQGALCRLALKGEPLEDLCLLIGF